MIDMPLLVEAEQLLEYLDDPRLRVIDLTKRSVYEQLHLPNAFHVKPAQLVRTVKTATGMLPDEKAMQDLLASLNLSKDSHIVVYDDEGGAWAGRLIWNLHCIGIERVSLLNGGIHRWIKLKYPIMTEPCIEEKKTDIDAIVFNSKYRIDYEAVKLNVESKQYQLWDCRSKEEYTGVHLAARLGGHIPDAKNYEWSSLIDRSQDMRLHSIQHIKQRLEQHGLDLSRPLIVYCQSHHRSGLAYIVARLLDWDVKAYDGGWSEWGNRMDSPVSSI